MGRRADRFPAIVEAARRLRPPSFLIDGEAIICRPDGVSNFDALRVGRRAHDVTLAAFDLIELQADDLRKEPLFNRKQRLAKILAGGEEAIVYNEHITHDGPTVFEHACRLGLEGHPYRSGPVKTWLKSKNPLSEAVRREREEDWRWRTGAAPLGDGSCFGASSRRINSLIGAIQQQRAQHAPGTRCPIQNSRVATGDKKLTEFKDAGVARHQNCD